MSLVIKTVPCNSNFRIDDGFMGNTRDLVVMTMDFNVNATTKAMQLKSHRVLHVLFLLSYYTI